MRLLILLVIGLVVGAVSASTVSNILRQRDAYPRGLMNVMQHNLQAARSAALDGKCAQPAQTAALAHLDLLAADIEPTFLAPDSRDDVFRRYAKDLRTALAKVAAPGSGSDCAGQGVALTEVANACDACHRDYR